MVVRRRLYGVLLSLSWFEVCDRAELGWRAMVMFVASELVRRS
jgi:hypothetical protein